MSLTLLVENNPKLAGFYALNLSVWLDLKTSTKGTVETALDFLNTEKSLAKLIITRSHIAQNAAFTTIMEHLKKKGMEIPVIVIGPAKATDGAYAHVSNSLQVKPLIQAAAKALGITAKEMTNKTVPDYFPIPIEHFKNLTRAVCAVYTQDPGDGKRFIPRLDKQEVFDEYIIRELVREGNEHLYVNKLDRLECVNHINAELMSALDGKDLSEDEAVVAADKGVELLSKKLLSMGVTEETVALANRSMDTIKRNVNASPKLAKLLERLLSNQASYLYKHTQLLTYVSLHIIRNVDWGNPEQEEKITFISFFHDIVLENDIQGQIRSARELKEALLSPIEKQLVEKHAMLAAEYVSKFPRAPMGADQIIRQHHGNLNGIGFSEHFGNNVSPVAVVFIVAEEFTRIILKQPPGDYNRKEMLRELKSVFPTSRFQKVISLLESITF